MNSPDTNDRAGVMLPKRPGSPWLAMLRRCLRYCGTVVVALAAAGGLVSGWQGIGSVLFGAVVVVTFSGITLVIGHRAGPEDPTRAMSLFVVAYAVKVIGFGALLLVPGPPSWVIGEWFLAAALASVIAWQFAELREFAESRRLLYGDGDDVATRLPEREPTPDIPAANHQEQKHE